MSSSYQKTIGSREEVWAGTAEKTSGGLTKNDLIMTGDGRIISKAKHNAALRGNIDERLHKSDQ